MLKKYTTPMPEKANHPALTKFIVENDCFELINRKIICKLCCKEFSYRVKDGVSPLKKHMKTKLHVEKEHNNTKKQTILNVKSTNSLLQKQFDIDLLELITGLNLPLKKLCDPKFVGFLKKYTNYHIKSETWFRTDLLVSQYDKELKDNLDYFKKRPIYLLLDETTDPNGRFVCNILIGECSETCMHKPILIKTCFLDKTASDNIKIELLKLLEQIMTVDDFFNFKLLVTDAASYCLKLGRDLKGIFSSLKHVTCVAHAMHRISEFIRSKCGMVDNIINTIKKYLLKNKDNQKVFSLECNFKMPKLPIVTRWGMWIEFAIAIAINYNELKPFLIKMNDKYNDNVLEVYTSDLFVRELNFIFQYKQIPAVIERLQSSTLVPKLLVNELLNFKNSIPDETVKIKFNEILLKNPDIDFFINFDQIRSKKEERIYTNVPLTTVEVERSFSSLKLILSDNRRCMGLDTLSALLFFYFNK